MELQGARKVFRWLPGLWDIIFGPKLPKITKHTKHIKLYNDVQNCQTKVVAIHGGNNVLRNSDIYLKTVTLCRNIALAGYIIINNGEPGISEAASLGALLANFDESSIDVAIGILSTAPDYRTDINAWYNTMHDVTKQFNYNNYSSYYFQKFDTLLK